MSGRREFVQRLGRMRNLAAGLLTLAAVGGAAASPGRIEPRSFARAYVPGEVVRFAVVTDPEVSELTGSFLSTPLSFVRTGASGPDARWVAFGVIPLDAAPGVASYRLSVAGAGGSSGSIDGTIPVSAKSFPEQRLTVEPKFVNPPKAARARIERETKRLKAIYARRSLWPPPVSPFVKPVPGDPTGEFGTRRIFNGEPRAPHSGIDLHAPTGTPVLASGPGRVALAASLYYSGGTVIVDHGGGLFTNYAHLSRIETKEGETVRAGDRVGRSGATGRVTGPHLHWGAKIGEAIFDPRALLDPRLFGE